MLPLKRAVRCPPMVMTRSIKIREVPCYGCGCSARSSSVRHVPRYSSLSAIKMAICIKIMAHGTCNTAGESHRRMALARLAAPPSIWGAPRTFPIFLTLSSVGHHSCKQSIDRLCANSRITLTALVEGAYLPWTKEERRAIMSRHLRVLRASGFVEVATQDESDARLRLYRLRPEPFVSLKEWVDGATAFWTTQLKSFKSYVEQTPAKSGATKRGART